MNLTRKAVERAWLTTCCSPQPARKSLAKHAYIPGDCPQVILQEIARKIRGETQGLSPSLYGSLYGRENRIAAKKRRSMAYPTLLGDPTRACQLLRLHRPVKAQPCGDQPCGHHLRIQIPGLSQFSLARSCASWWNGIPEDTKRNRKSSSNPLG